jgi:hypothetical protein
MLKALFLLTLKLTNSPLSLVPGRLGTEASSLLILPYFPLSQCDTQSMTFWVGQPLPRTESLPWSCRVCCLPLLRTLQDAYNIQLIPISLKISAGPVVKFSVLYPDLPLAKAAHLGKDGPTG